MMSDATPLTPELRLTEFDRAYYRPVVLVARGAAAGTLKQHDQSMRYWCQLTADPPIRSITQMTCAAFVAGLTEIRGPKGDLLSPNTIRKHCITVQPVLDCCGPRGRGRAQRLAVGIVAEVPYLERPPAREKPPTDSYTLDEVAEILKVCHLARWPKGVGVPPAVWWDALVRFLLNVGLRIETTMAATWAMVQRRPDGFWIVIPPEIYKGRRHGLQLPLNCEALAAIERVKTADPHLFPWPHGLWHLQSCRRKLLAESGLPPERRLGFHALRKTLATSLARIDAKLAQAAMGHAAFDTTRQSYIHPEVLRDVFQKLPQVPGQTKTE
jgi:integrase